MTVLWDASDHGLYRLSIRENSGLKGDKKLQTLILGRSFLQQYRKRVENQTKYLEVFQMWQAEGGETSLRSRDLSHMDMEEARGPGSNDRL